MPRCGERTGKRAGEAADAAVYAGRILVAQEADVHRFQRLIRDSASSGRSMEWIRIHELPDFVYFNHAAHLRGGVGCVECHGRIDQMEVVHQEKPLSMSWCLDCHRNPAPHLRPPDQVTNMRWTPSAKQAEFAAAFIAERDIKPPTDCWGCHR